MRLNIYLQNQGTDFEFFHLKILMININLEFLEKII